MTDDLTERIARRLALRLSKKKCGPDDIRIVALVRENPVYLVVS